MSTLGHLRALGFDQSYRAGFTRILGVPTSTYRPKCSQCEAVVINGVPTHESGCPNALHECRGCNELIPVNCRYCADCSQ